MSLYGYPREPEPSADEEYFVVPPAPETVPPPAPLLPSDPPGFTELPPYPNGHGAYSNGEAVPGPRRVPEAEFAPPMESSGAFGDSLDAGWQVVTGRPSEAPTEPGWHDLVPRSVDPGSGRHRTVGADDVEAVDEESGFRWLGGDQPGFGPSPRLGQPTVEPPGFGPSPSMGQPAVPFGVPGIPATRSAPVEPPTNPPAPAHVHVARGDRTFGRAATMPGRSAPTGPSDAEIAALLDEPEAVPWDRRPLMIVIATAIVLVLIGVVSAFVTAWLVGPTETPSWHEETPQSGAPVEPGS